MSGTGAIIAVLGTLFGLLPGLAACAGSGKGEPVPAVLVAPDAADIAEVARAAGALTGESVTLSDDVLTESPTLALDRQMPRSIENNPAGGRIMERPPTLKLVIKGRQCLLVDEATGKSETLAGVACEPFKAP